MPVERAEYRISQRATNFVAMTVCMLVAEVLIGLMRSWELGLVRGM